MALLGFHRVYTNDLLRLAFLAHAVLLTCSVLSCDPPHDARASASKLDMLKQADLQDDRNTLTKKHLGICHTHATTVHVERKAAITHITSLHLHFT